MSAVVATPDGTTKGYLDIHDGESASDPLVIRIRANINQSKSIIFDPPIHLDKGLYIYMDGVLEYALLVWEFHSIDVGDI